MHASSKYFLIAAGLIVAGAGAYFIFHDKPDASGKQAHNPVQIVKTELAQQKTLSITVQANGYVTAINTVDVRPQVQNIVRSVHVHEGDNVRAGQLLFTLDERSELTNVEKARAAVASTQAELVEAENSLKRNQDLLHKKFVSQAVVDTARSKAESLRSTLEGNQAASQGSTVALGYNRINASISGRIGLITVHPGSLAQPSGEPMVRISQLDPIAISFALPESELANIIATYPKRDAPVTAQISGGQALKGKLIFIDNETDTQSGTIKMKAEFANQAQKLWPGMFVNVSLVSRVLPDVVVIPAQAVVTGPTEAFVYMVQADNTVKQQKINVLTIEDGVAAVAGIGAGTRVVVEGAQNLRPGSKVEEVKSAKP
jgi:multidrug efflux system membrane fusion protein